MVICFEFPDVPHSTSIQTIKNTAIDQVNKFYQDVSYGQLSIEGEIYGWYMMPMALRQFDVCRWATPSGESQRLVETALSVAPHHFATLSPSYTFLVFSGAVWGFAYPTLRITVQNEKHSWSTYAHELGHIIGLPDLYSYGEARTGGDSSIFAGSWDLMSVPSSGTMCAWSRMKAGWIQKNQIAKGEMGSSVTISPLELGKEMLVARIEYSYSAVRYYLVEVRLGYGVLITDIDEKEQGGYGIVKVIDAHPESKTLSDACFNIWEKGSREPNGSFFYSGHLPVYINPYRTFAIVILARIGDSYKISLTTTEIAERALKAHDAMQSADSAIQKAQTEIRIEGLDQANSTLDQAITNYQQGKFTEATLIAENAKTLAEKATIPKTYYEAKQAIETTGKSLTDALARKPESQEATAKLEEAAAALGEAKKAFQSLQFHLVLVHIENCKSRILEAQQLENNFQTRRAEIIISVLAIAAIALVALARRRKKTTSSSVCQAQAV